MLSQLRISAAPVCCAVLVATVVLGGRGVDAREPVPAAASPTALLQTSDWGRAPLGSLDPRVFELALKAASCSVRAGKVANPSTLTVIDYSKPSTEKRLWVVDLRTRALLFEEIVAHGQGSGANMATQFSNQPETHRSSLGLFATRDTYIGKNGYSLRLDGLDPGFNDHAMDRAIVIHGAPYVSEALARAQGRLGRSWGCPALRESVAHDLIDRVKGSGLVFAYYPDPRWLASSPFLGDCYGGDAVPVVAAG